MFEIRSSFWAVMDLRVVKSSNRNLRTIEVELNLYKLIGDLSNLNLNPDFFSVFWSMFSIKKVDSGQFIINP